LPFSLSFFSSEDPLDDEPLIPEDVSLELPLEPLMPDEPLVPVEPLPLVLVSEPAELDPAEPEEPDAPEEPDDPDEPDEPEEPEEPDEPELMISIFFALTVSPEPEKLARTLTPSLMSSSEARLPSFSTWVLESTLRVLSLPESVSVLFERSKL
jgi:hypothetical protein